MHSPRGEEAAGTIFIMRVISRAKSVMLQSEDQDGRGDHDSRSGGAGALPGVRVMEPICLALPREPVHSSARSLALAGGNPRGENVADGGRCPLGRGGL